MAEFLNMGGYAAFVWSSYAIAAAVLIVNIVGPRRIERTLLAELERLYEESKHDTTAP